MAIYILNRGYKRQKNMQNENRFSVVRYKSVLNNMGFRTEKKL